MLRSALLNVMIKAARKAGAQPQARLRRGRAPAGLAEGAGAISSPPPTGAPRRSCARNWRKARPGYGFLGEEGGAREGTDKTHTWIVDPLDGTTNFLHGIPHFAISIALEREGTIVAGARSTIRPTTSCSPPSAARARSSTISGCASPRASGSPTRSSPAGCRISAAAISRWRGDEIAAVQEQVAGLRRFGAAALDLAWVAAGRFDAYWERDLSPWDMAAGMLLVREAGGFVSDLDGGDGMFAKGDIAAGNDTMHRELLRLLKAAGKEPANEKRNVVSRRGWPQTRHQRAAGCGTSSMDSCRAGGLTASRRA